VDLLCPTINPKEQRTNKTPAPVCLIIFLDLRVYAKALDRLSTSSIPYVPYDSGPPIVRINGRVIPATVVEEPVLATGLIIWNPAATPIVENTAVPIVVAIRA
jgi:hypothetical protein